MHVACAAALCLGVAGGGRTAETATKRCSNSGTRLNVVSIFPGSGMPGSVLYFQDTRADGSSVSVHALPPRGCELNPDTLPKPHLQMLCIVLLAARLQGPCRLGASFEYVAERDRNVSGTAPVARRL